MATMSGRARNVSSKQKRLAIGIDLGTTYSLAAMVSTDEQSVHVFHTPNGEYLLPSAVYFEDDVASFGSDVIRNGRDHYPKHVIDEVKRLVGRDYTSSAVQTMKRQKTYKITQGPNSSVQIEIPRTNGKYNHTPEDISSLILGHIVEYVQQQAEMTIESAVITVPAYFDNAQRQATKMAAEAAGIKVARLLNEPSAAAFAFQKKQKLIHGAASYRALIFDFGGGTCDVSLLEVAGEEMKILAVSGDTHLGGADIDEILVDWAIREYHKKYQVSITESRTRTRERMENAKKILCNQLGARREIKIHLVGNDHKERPLVLSHIVFNTLIQDIVTRCVDLVNKTLNDVYKNSNYSLEYFVAVGGSSRVPVVIETLEKRLGVKANKCAHPDQAVAEGAAIFADSLQKGNAMKFKNKLRDVTALALGVGCLWAEDADDAPLRFSKIIPASTPIPIHRKHTYSTRHDDQTQLLNKIYEGENPLAEKNLLLGKFLVKDLPPRPRGQVEEIVTFSIDDNGIFNATATIPALNRDIHYHVNDFYATGLNKILATNAGYQAKHTLVLEQQEAKHKLEEYLSSVQKILDETQSSRCADIDANHIRGRIEVEQKWLSDNPEANAQSLKSKRESLEDASSYQIEILKEWTELRASLNKWIDTVEEAGGWIAHDRTLPQLLVEAQRVRIEESGLTQLRSTIDELAQNFTSAQERRSQAIQTFKDVLERLTKKCSGESENADYHLIKYLATTTEWFEENQDECASVYESKFEDLSAHEMRYTSMIELKAARSHFKDYLIKIQRQFDDNQVVQCADIDAVDANQIRDRVNNDQKWLLDNPEANAQELENKLKILQNEFSDPIKKLEHWMELRKSLEGCIATLKEAGGWITHDQTLSQLLVEAQGLRAEGCTSTKLRSLIDDLEDSFRSAQERRSRAKQSFKDALETLTNKCSDASENVDYPLVNYLVTTTKWFEENQDECASVYESKFEDLNAHEMRCTSMIELKAAEGQFGSELEDNFEVRELKPEDLNIISEIEPSVDGFNWVRARSL